MKFNSLQSVVQSEGLLSFHMARAPAIPPVCAALGGVSEHVVAPLLVLLLHGVVVFGVCCAHHVQLLVLHLEVTVATSLVDVSNVFDASTGQTEDRGCDQEGRSEDWTAADTGRE